MKPKKKSAKPQAENPAAIPTRNEGLLTKEQLAAMLGIKPRTVAKWALAGKLPTLRVGCLLRFKWAEIENSLRRASEAKAETLKR
ncbi:MAG: helix-turn-helix domain-containing protein [Verrucomicrobiota bacterium]